MEIKVRNSIRVLGIILSFIGFFGVYLMLKEFNELSNYEMVLLIFGGLFFFPLVLSSSILGRVPYFISTRIPKLFEETTLNAEKNFTVFSFESVVGAIVALTIIFLNYYFLNLD